MEPKAMSVFVLETIMENPVIDFYNFICNIFMLILFFKKMELFQTFKLPELILCHKKLSKHLKFQINCSGNHCFWIEYDTIGFDAYIQTNFIPNPHHFCKR